MKKILSFILVFALCLSVFALVSCGDEACEHTWNEGEVTTDATETADGQKTFTCTACGATKNEAFKFAGISEEKWEEITSKPKFVNYTLNQTAVMNIAGQGEYEQKVLIKFTEGKVEIDLDIEGNGTVLTYEGFEAEQQRQSYEDVFLALIDKFENFTYDKETKTYKNPETITANIEMEAGTVGKITAVLKMTNGEISLDADGNIAKITCALTQSTTASGETHTASTDSMTWELSNYGTTVIEPAAQ